MPTQCCVPLCTNRGGGHSFPGVKREEIRRLWVLAIRREDNNVKGRLWEPSRHSIICYDHFQPADYPNETYYGGKPQQKRLKDTAVPSIFKWNAAKSETTGTERASRLKNRLQVVMPEVEVESANGLGDTDMMQVDEELEVGAECDVQEEGARQLPQAISVETQTRQSGAPMTTCDQAVNTDPTPSLSAEKFKDDPAGMHHFTGLETYTKFMFVLATLGPAAHHLNYMYGHVNSIISVVDRFFLVLIKLRKHTTNFELSRLFNISESDVYNLFCTWVRFISMQWREAPLWGTRDLIRFYAPTGFKDQYPKTRVIIDGTECPIKKPHLPTAQRSTYSTYKNRNTIKVLAGISPGGMCTYMSPAFGGSTSDRQIVERSNLPHVCDPGDSIMSDKGFDVQDIFAPFGVSINIPTFFRKKNRMSQDTVLHDRKIASKRIHIERFIGLAKTYAILKQPLNSSETILSSDILFICFMLCNFRSGIVSQNA